MDAQDVKKAETILLNEFLTVETLIDYGHKRLAVLLQVGNHIHNSMHMVEDQDLFEKFGMTPEKLKEDHEILVNNMDKVESAIRHHEKYTVVYFNQRPLFFHAN